MLSDIDVNNLIQPFEARQKMFEDYVVQLIAKRVGEIGKLLPSDIHRLERLYKTGSDVRAINKALVKLTGLQEREVKKLIKEVAADCYIDAKPYYDYRHTPYIPLAQNKALQTVIAAISAQTQKTFRNLSNSKMIGFMIRDRRNPRKLRFYNIEQAYKSIVDEAIQAVQSGIVDYNTAMRKTLRQLNNSGLKRIYWESGYSQRLDTAVKRNILDGVKQINIEANLIIGKQFGADGVELSAHELSAPDHEPFQGHQFKKEEYEKLQNNQSFQDVKGNRFKAQERIIGQWNCKHFAYPIIIGVMKPTYSEDQLKRMMNRNKKGITLPSGKHLSGYEATQYQNELALKVRQAKDGQIMARDAGDAELAKQYQIKVNEYTKKYNTFNSIAKSQMQLSDRRDKLTVSGYRRMSIK